MNGKSVNEKKKRSGGWEEWMKEVADEFRSGVP